MGFAKHTFEGQKIRELQEIIDRKDEEIKDIKVECAEQFRLIRDLCFINDYNDRNAKLRKIHEVASDNFSALVKDIIIADSEENISEDKSKIIELPTTRKSNK